MVGRLSLAGSRFPCVVFVVAGLTVFFAATACSGSESATSEETTDSQATSSSEATTAEGFAAEDQLENPLSAASGGETLTPVLVSLVGGDTAAVRGSDGRYYAVYELLLTNASSSAADLEAVEVLDTADGTEVLRGSRARR